MAVISLEIEMLTECETFINDKTSHDAREFFDRMMRIPLSDTILADAIDIYAYQEVSEDEREVFLETYTHYPQYDLVKKAVLDAVIAVFAADEIKNDEVFYQTIHLLDGYEEDTVILKMKQAMLHKLIRDASDDLQDMDEKRLLSRMCYVEKLFAERV